MNLFSILDQTAARLPERDAVFRGTQPLCTFAGLRSRALRIAGGLRRNGGPGDRVAIVTENAPEYVELFFAIWAAGMVATPVNAKLHPRELAEILGDSGATVAFVSAKIAAGLEPALKKSPAAACRCILIGGDDYAALMTEELTDPIDPSPDALAWLFYTSGTTGRSKGAMLSHRNLLAMTIAHIADMESFGENPGGEASLLHGAPMSHGSGLYIPAYILRGARQVVPASSGFDPAEFIGLCDHHPACRAFLAPTMVQRLRLEVEASGRRPANLATVVYGGGPMYVEELRKSLATFGQVFVQIYGQGEAPMTITGLRRDDHAVQDERILGSVGHARSGVEVAVVDAQGRPLPAGEIGEIVCRGDVVMSGYWNNPGATAEALRDGWLYTGDMGELDARGYLTLRDRSKDVISGGSNIYPREVEEVLLRHPDVVEVCVTGQAEAEWGEIVVAFVVPRPGVDLASAALDAHCNANIARFKRPKRYILVEALPKNNYGKVLKRELRQRLADGI